MFEWATEKRFGGEPRDYVERFEAMDLPLLVIAGTNDDLAPPASVRPAYVREPLAGQDVPRAAARAHRSARRSRRAALHVADGHDWLDKRAA